MTSWSPATEASLRDLWKKDCTASQIARALGTTKDAVLGKAHRLGLSRMTPALARGAELRRARREADAAAFFEGLNRREM